MTFEISRNLSNSIVDRFQSKNIFEIKLGLNNVIDLIIERLNDTLFVSLTDVNFCILVYQFGNAWKVIVNKKSSIEAAGDLLAALVLTVKFFVYIYFMLFVGRWIHHDHNGGSSDRQEPSNLSKNIDHFISSSLIIDLILSQNKVPIYQHVGVDSFVVH